MAKDDEGSPADSLNEASLDLFEKQSDASLESEKSYEPLFKKTELYETLTYLTFNLVWMFLAAFANVILFMVFTYETVFDENFGTKQNIFLLVLFCDGLVIADMIAAIIHWTWKYYAAFKDLSRRHKFLIILDITSIVWMVIDLVPNTRKTKWVAMTGIAFVAFRLYRVIHFFYIVSRTPGLDTFIIIVNKYGVIIFTLVHTLSCIMRALGCYDCGKNNWVDTQRRSIDFNKNEPEKWYLICLYFIVSIVSSVGFGDVHPVTDAELFVITATMICSFFLIVGAFLGALTTVQTESYRRHAAYSNRLYLISKSLDYSRLAKPLKTKIMNFYLMFWQQQHGIQYSYLFEQLPDVLKLQVYLDKYWIGLQQTYLLKNVHPAFLRAIASKMSTEIYTAGDTIYAQGQQKNYMVYVLRGTIQILSAEDGESPILTLGIGTCLGEASLFYSMPSPVQVIASSYCEIQRLKKEDFWRLAIKYRKLNQIQRLRDLMKKKMADAQRFQMYQSNQSQEDIMHEHSLALRTVKAKLKTEDSKRLSTFYIYRQRSMKEVQKPMYSDLYVLSQHQTTLKHSDEICLRNSWPWVLQPQSVMLTIWEHFVCICVMMVAILYPYQISYVRHFPHFMTLIIVVIDGVYIIDILLQIFTAVEDENGIITQVSEIFTIRCRMLSFIIDVLAILPLTLFAQAVNITKNTRILTILSVNRILKFHRVIMLLKKHGASFNMNVALMRCIKYVMYFLMLAYYMGAIFYMLACFDTECTKDSWIDDIKKEDVRLGTLRHKHAFELSIYFGSLVISQSGYGDVAPHNFLELCFTMIFFVMGTLLFCYLVADYSATLMLADRQRRNYVEMVTIIKQYLTSNQVLASIQARTNKYLALQWRINKGYTVLKDQSVLFDAPQHLFQKQQSVKYHNILSNIPLFEELDAEHISAIAAEIKQVYLSPYEIVNYAGEVVRNMYIIDRGFCEVISVATGKIEKILGPPSNLCDFDMLLERPGIHHIRTVTHARILKISHITIKKVLVAANLYEQTKKLAEQVKSSLAVQRLFLRRESITYQSMESEEKTSWFVFSRKKLSARNIDYEKAFDNMGVWKFLKLFLLRRTIMPDGKFLLIWELFQAIRIFIMGYYYVSLIFVNAYTLYGIYISIFFDALGIIDLYIRMHVCYYNENGILVTHPRYTALHYISSSFIIDLLSVLPISLFLRLMVSARGANNRKSTMYKITSFLRLNKLLQIYRILGVFNYFEHNILRETKIILYIAKCLPLTVLFFNALSTVLVTMTSTIREDSQGYFIIEPTPTSWIGVEKEKRRFNISVPINLYVSAYYWVANTGLQIGYGNFIAWQVSEMYFCIFVVVSGYLLVTYTLVLISSNKATININLTLYQEHIKHLISFMRREKIERELKERVVDHFEYIWQRTHGMKASSILKRCHLALRKDTVLYLYENTFVEVPIFNDLPKSFFRTLGMNVEEAYFMKYSTIIRLNDIINSIYIIHKGEATVIAPDGSVFATLTRGCMFGNIDNSSTVRSTICVVANKAVDLLCISTEKLYSLATDYPVISNRLRRHILVENTSYIEKKPVREQFHIYEDSFDKKKSSFHEKLKKITAIGLFPVPMMIASYLSCFVIMYHLAFQNESFIMFAITYGLDVVHLFKLYVGFYMPYRNHMGELITDPKKIRKRFLTLSRFYLELTALIPLDVFAVLAPKDNVLYYLTWLRINRMLRMWNIYHFFNVTFDRLNINMLIIKLGSVCIYFTLAVHIGSCILYMFACPRGKCLKTSWIYNDNGTIKDNNHYLLSIYFMMVTISCTGIGDVSAVTVPEMAISVVIFFTIKFLEAIFIGDISAMVQNYSYTLVSYDYNIAALKDYLQHSYVVAPLIKKVLDYVDQLWQTERGLQVPVLLEEAPSYLLEDLKAAAYGKHLFENYLFAACHVDFLRQLIVKLKAITFFRGNIICHQGDVNNSMYFIHKGRIRVYANEGTDEVQVDELNKMDCFGLVQGLIACTPHTHTYKAQTVVVVLTLDLFDWVHLLKYFRAARSEIYSRLQKMDTFASVQQT